MKIIIENVTKKYGEQVVLENFNLIVEDRERIHLVAPSGAGKTTLLRLIAGLERPQDGSVRFEESALRTEKLQTEIEGTAQKGTSQKNIVAKPRISYVFQEDRLLEHLTAVDNLKAVLGQQKTHEEYENELREIGLTEFEHKKVAELSGGQRRRVAIVRAMLAESDILLMDEPFNGLDESAVEVAAKYVEKRIGERIFILVTHDHGDSILLTIHTVMLK